MASHPKLLLLLTSILLVSQASGRILSKCEAVQELERAGISRTFISNYVCIMKSESNFDTKKVTGPGHKSSYSYGVFQISSDYWCSRYRPGGACHKHCEDFLDDDIQDDIACAKIIFETMGFKYWKKWLKNCKNGDLPKVSCCNDQKNNLTNLFKEDRDLPPVELSHLSYFTHKGNEFETRQFVTGFA